MLESSLIGWLRGRAPTRQETATHRAKPDSDKFGHEAGDQTCGLIEPCIHLKFFMEAPLKNDFVEQPLECDDGKLRGQPTHCLILLVVSWQLFLKSPIILSVTERQL